MEEKEKTHFRNGKFRWSVKGLVALVLAVLVFLGGVSVLTDFFGSGSKELVMIEVTEGAGASSIAGTLKKEGIIRHPNLFKLYTRLYGDAIYQKGKHSVSNSMSYQDIVQVLTSAPEVDEKDIRRVVIPEGYELWQIVDLLVENGLGEKAVFLHEIENGSFDFPFVAKIPQRANRLEGYLYPDTYLFSVQETEYEILYRMLENFNQKVIPVYHAYGGDKTLDEVLIFASVIEREAANDKERPLVASVFKNRMEIGMKLESCATVQYILKERKTVLSKDDIAIDSPYNTYLYTGLPIGPIASPGIASVEAALHPADTDYLYFLATADGSGNLFSKTFEEHNRKTVETQN